MRVRRMTACGPTALLVDTDLLRGGLICKRAKGSLENTIRDLMYLETAIVSFALAAP
jgi:hypothetical protein